MNYELFREYLEITTEDEYDTLREVFNLFYDKVEFSESEIREYNFYEKNIKALRALEDFGIIEVENGEYERYYSTIVTQLEMAKIREEFEEFDY